jgi:hypothetical protein
MTSFVMIPGAGGTARYWHRLVPLPRASSSGWPPAGPALRGTCCPAAT